MLHGIVICSLLAGIMIALASAPFGCFLVWKRISSFSDAVSHIALPGISLGIVLHISPFFLSALTVFLTSILISFIKGKSKSSANSILVSLSGIGMGLGITILSLSGNASSFESLLFGDILSVTSKDLWVIATVTLSSLIVLYLIKDKLLLSILSEDIALIEGINVNILNMIFMLLLAFIVAISINTVGILLVSSLLIIPAVSSRFLANTYKSMLLLSSLIGSIGVVSGIFISFKIDVPPIPAIVTSLGFYLFVIFLVQILIKYFKKAINDL